MNKINSQIIIHLMGVLLLFNGIFMFLSAFVSIITDDGVILEISLAATTVTVFGSILMLLTKNHSKKIQKKDGYIIVALGWILMSFSGTLPYLFTNSISDFTNAIFETTSGYTTTGSSILTDIEILPQFINKIVNENYDIVIASRLIKGSKVIGRSLKREIISRTYSKIFRTILSFEPFSAIVITQSCVICLERKSYNLTNLFSKFLDSLYTGSTISIEYFINE